MKRLGMLLLVIVLSTSVWASISAKAGLAGGAFRISGVLDLRQVNDKLGLAGEAGYALGQQYSAITVGLIGNYKLRGNLTGFMTLGYSAYSDPVNLPLLGDIREKAGVGAGIGLRMELRKPIYAQVGIDSRLGALAEVGYIVRM